MIDINKIYCEDHLKTMARMPDDFVDMVLTSPPYDDLREYKGYTFDFESCAREIYRVLKVGGRVVWVVGDQVRNFNRSLTSFKQTIRFQEIGFLVNDVIIYEKSTFSAPHAHLYHQTHEYMLVMSKEKPETFNPIVDKKNLWASHGAFGKNSFRGKDGFTKDASSSKKRKFFDDYGKRTNVWKLKTSAQEKPCQKIEHPATFGLQLAKDHMYSWSNPGDLVYDPMAGSMTTARAAIALERNFICSEISEEYVREFEPEVKALQKQIRMAI